jgi:polyribonucleotide nucleotidyltransferase
LLHISEISDRRIKDVRDELKEGQQVMVKCIGKEGNKVKLSRKAILKEEKSRAETN